MERFYPAKRYVMIDDKLHILNTIKNIWGERVRTVFPKQGHYARDPHILATSQPADIQLGRIDELNKCPLAAFASNGGGANFP